jgi:sulfate transport system ATP-binding protein
MSITVKNVTKRFGDFLALDNVNLEVPPGEMVAQRGHTFYMRTTLRRIMTGGE